MRSHPAQFWQPCVPVAVGQAISRQDKRPDLACTLLRHSIGAQLSQCGTYRMDHQKFLVYGVGMFSGIITALFPLSVIKIRQMSSTDCSPGLAGARDTGRQILRQEGIRGLYRGYGTVLAGAIPVRRRPSAPNQLPSSQLPSNVQRLFSGAGHSGAGQRCPKDAYLHHFTSKLGSPWSRLSLRWCQFRHLVSTSTLFSG